MEETYLTILRDKETKTAEFRWAAHGLARLLIPKVVAKLPMKSRAIETPIGAAQGAYVTDDVMGVPILRAGTAFVPALMDVLPGVPIGYLGMARDEKTAEASVYCEKLPPELYHYAVIMDPMLATGGSVCLTVEILKHAGYDEKNVFFVGMFAAQVGFDRLKNVIPEGNIVVASNGAQLDERFYIIGGCGDFGDRYCGTM
ncbi:MAG: uracil phosphoribosyltransferase [bacterium]|nr:uracil phosphoribosyltransferase [bacterium]